MIKNIIRVTREILALTVIASLFLAVLIPVLEPQLANAVEDQFTVTQSVTGEISFLTPAADVTLPSIPGLTGGTSLGQTQVVVTTNDSSGYTMTIKASSSPAMQGNTQGGNIPDYTSASASIPDFAYSVPTGAEMGYTISASTTADLAQKFLDNGSACNTGAADTTGSTSCWYGLSTTATTTNVRATATPASGATTTIFFQLKINAGSVVEDTYTATTTLTATAN
ncbi:MAG: hypothetical protein M3Q24_02120 [bacterium]|nr:hypothetical protein [bacterium]